MGFRLFVLLERRSSIISSMPWRVQGTFVCCADNSVGIQSCPTPRGRPTERPDPTRPWYVQVLDSTGDYQSLWLWYSFVKLKNRPYLFIKHIQISNHKELMSICKMTKLLFEQNTKDNECFHVVRDPVANVFALLIIFLSKPWILSTLLPRNTCPEKMQPLQRESAICMNIFFRPRSEQPTPTKIVLYFG